MIDQTVPGGSVSQPSDRPSPALSLKLLRQIFVDAASAHTAEQQISHLVSQVKQAMQVDVCSLYQLDDTDMLRMVANQGLAEGVWGTIALRLDEGLVGTIAASRLPLNLRVAQEHPAYRFFSGSGEEAFQAFLGAPIINLGRTIGVVVVQDRDQRGFTEDEEAFLVTIAAQLSGVMSPLLPAPASCAPGERNIHGRAGAPGKAIGRLHLVIEAATLNLVDEPAATDPESELALLASAIEIARQQIEAARARMAWAAADGTDGLFDIYSQMLANDRLTIVAEQKIRDGASAFAAVRASVDEHARAFEAIDDEYLRARAEDVRHVGQTLLSALLGHSLQESEVTEDVVLLGSAVSITDIARHEPRNIAAIVCMKGSKLSHTAVLARALGIPAVVATGPIDHIHEGDLVMVDGDQGVVRINPSRVTQLACQTQIEAARSFEQELSTLRDLPAMTTDDRRICLMTNTGLLADINPGIHQGAEGVGLYRSEIAFLSARTFPTESEQIDVYRNVLQAYAPKPVSIRTLDIGGDKQLPYLSVEEENPALGWRGIRFSLDNRSILVTQLRAMLKASEGLENLRIMLPMISTVAEVREVSTLIDNLLETLADEGCAIARPSLGIMVEVPGVIPLLEHIAPWIDFVSVGTNDLVQYLLAVDRTNGHVADYYNHLHPAVIQTLKTICDKAHTLDLNLSVCGEMATDPCAVVLLVGMGVTTLSVSAVYLPKVKAVVRGLSFASAQRCLADALTAEDAESIRTSVTQLLGNLGLATHLSAQ